jgi:hypothetical protein
VNNPKGNLRILLAGLLKKGIKLERNIRRKIKRAK